MRAQHALRRRLPVTRRDDGLRRLRGFCQQHADALRAFDQLDDDRRSADPLIQEALTTNAEYVEVFRHSDLLEAEGFTVERGVADMPTAFVATFGSGKPVIGVLAELEVVDPALRDRETA